VADTGGSSETERLEPAAVVALYAHHADELRAYLLGLLRDVHLADEALQAAFAKAVERGHTARGDTLKAWLFRVAHNEAIDLRRRSAAEGRSVRAVAWWKTRVEPPPEQAATRRETVEQVRKAVEALPAEQREVVRLRIDEEKTFAEIAALTGKPLGTILTRMRLATKKLADALRGELEP
jgi:RNA polymerase sigma-70 factor (ECF subfamily)